MSSLPPQASPILRRLRDLYGPSADLEALESLLTLKDQQLNTLREACERVVDNQRAGEIARNIARQALATIQPERNA